MDNPVYRHIFVGISELFLDWYTPFPLKLGEQLALFRSWVGAVVYRHVNQKDKLCNNSGILADFSAKHIGFSKHKIYTY